MTDKTKDTHEINSDKTKNTESKTLMIPEAASVSIVRGKSYDILAENQIVRAKIQKIYEDPTQGACVILTVPFRKNFKNFFKSRTNAMTLVEFKQRMMQGGIEEMQI